MDIILGKNGRLYLNESGTPLEGKLPVVPVVFLADPKPGDSIVYDGEKWVPGAGGGAKIFTQVTEDEVTYLELDGERKFPASVFLGGLCWIADETAAADTVTYLPVDQVVIPEDGYATIIVNSVRYNEDDDGWIMEAST